MKNYKLKKYIMNLTPLFGLAALFIAFLIIGTIQDINIGYGMKNIINQSVVVAVVATGAIFIYTLGSFDISLGASVAVSALLGGMVYNRTENLWVMTLVCIGVAVFVGLFNSVLASVFNLPVFVTTIAMLSVLNALVLVLIKVNGTGSEIAVPSAAVKPLNNTPFKIAVLVLFVIICVIVFNFTKIGRMQKFQGGNPICAKLSGVSEKKMAIIAFVLSGIGVGLGAFLSIVYAPTLTKNTASSVGMDVIIAIVFGGMPVSGGARSKIYAAVIGAFSMTLLSQIMVMFNLNSGIGQMVKAAIFILVVFLATSDQRGKMLPR
ncbi:MAG: ABC transporter permease [Muribaculaceae bacterium]|nr:ABC transporter permease [Roseburia sp.]MCM1430767.1 ABC transporter permease [Muribaculaceae bacterium]MCM1492746.1 ABC transporter permease [Muribaculaceae bacterium]